MLLNGILVKCRQHVMVKNEVRYMSFGLVRDNILLVSSQISVEREVKRLFFLERLNHIYILFVFS
jgi:hypothetical protein